MSVLNKLNRAELVELVQAYDDYIQDANDGELYSDGWKPVCINEFYQNDLEFWRRSDGEDR